MIFDPPTRGLRRLNSDIASMGSLRLLVDGSEVGRGIRPAIFGRKVLRK